ncbi:MAG TPA: methionyl-tRNA formyltransferase [Acidimicrobiales bacterium]
MAVPPAHPRRLAYLGTPEGAVPSLRALHAAGFEIALVVSRPDKRRGRGSALSPSPVKAAAVELGLPVTDDLDEVLSLDLDLGVVVAYGRIIPRRVLEAVPMVNLHFSLLPRWRGAAPVERALLAGDERTGVCLMEVAEGLDTGGVYAVEETPIAADDTLATLRERLVEMGSEMLVRAMGDGLGTPTPQTGAVTLAAKVDPAELELDWARPVAELDRVVRLGGAWTTFRGKRLKVWQATAQPVHHGGAEPGTLDGLTVAAGTGGLALVQVQPEGKARQDAASWRNGARPVAGERLGS